MLVAVLSLSATGCVGSGKSKSLTSAEFVSAANAICREGTRRVTALTGSEQQSDELHQLEAFASRVLAEQRRTLQSLKDVAAPPERRTAFNGWLALMEGALEAGDRLIAATTAADQTAVASAVTKVDAATNVANSAATKLGLDECVAAGDTATSAP